MTRIMAILNVTPDSFYDGGRYLNYDQALEQAERLIAEGADLLDIGGESTRPGAAPVSEAEELERVVPLIKALQSRIPLSIDTTKVRVAEKALEAGATLINDISGFRDPAMQRLAAEAKVDICLMHMQGTPQTMQLDPHYPGGIISHLLQFFDRQVEQLVASGVGLERIILDPGIGFGKTVADNLQIIQNLPIIKDKGLKVLLGVSRKSFLQRILERPASEMLAATLMVNSLAIQAGVDFLRVHDVRPHRDLIQIWERLQAC